jgi:hypothetical protein
VLDRGRGLLLGLLDPGRRVRPVKEFGGSEALERVHRVDQPPGSGFPGEPLDSPSNGFTGWTSRPGSRRACRLATRCVPARADEVRDGGQGTQTQRWSERPKEVRRPDNRPPPTDTRTIPVQISITQLGEFVNAPTARSGRFLGATLDATAT